MPFYSIFLLYIKNYHRDIDPMPVYPVKRKAYLTGAVFFSYASILKKSLFSDKLLAN